MSWTKTKAAMATVALGATAFAASAPATAAENWSMATPWGGGPLLEYNAKGIAKDIEFLSNDDIKVEVFPGGTLGKALKVSDTVKKGVAEIGHNCVLPEFQRRGFGKRQVLEVLRRLQEKGVRKACVSTGEDPFFLPAQRMYLACGFREVERRKDGRDPRFGSIFYGRDL